MKLIEPELVIIESFAVTGLQTQTTNINEQTPNTAKLPSLWQEAFSKLQGTTPRFYGVYSQYDSDENGSYTVTAGIKLSPKHLEKFPTIQIQSGNYLQFKNSGPQPQAIIELWQAVWLYFKTSCEYKRRFRTDFEIYDENECSLFIDILFM